MKISFTKWILVIALLILVTGGGAWLVIRGTGTATGPPPLEAGERKILYYRSTMMLGEISQTPRKDSMGMEMVPVYEGEEDTVIKIDPITTQNMGIRTAEVVRGPVQRGIRTVGRIEFDETAVSEVTTRVPGWIEKLYVDSTGKLVHKDEPRPLLCALHVFVLTAPKDLGAIQAAKAAAREKETGANAER